MIEEKYSDFGFNEDISDIYDPKFSKSALNTQSIFRVSKKEGGKKVSKFSFVDSFFDEKAKLTNNFNSLISNNGNFETEELNQETPKKRSKKSKMELEMEKLGTNSKKSTKGRLGYFVYVQGFEHVLVKGGFNVRERYKKSLKLRYIGEKYFYINDVLTAKIYLDEENRETINELGLAILNKTD